MNKQVTGKMVNGKLQAEFVHCYFNCDTFKQKEIDYLNFLISTTRLNDYFSFGGYATISFDEEDTAHRYPLVSTLDDNGEKLPWGRRTTNCIVYDMKRTGKNDTYDKLFLYHTCSHNGAGIWYGWLLWDAKNKIIKHRFFISHDQQDLMQAMNRMIYHIPVTKTNEKILRESRSKSIRNIPT